MSDQTPPEDPPQPQYPAYPQYAQPTYGQPAYGQPAYGQQQWGYPAYGGAPVPSGARPGVVTTAHILSWVALGINLLGMLLVVLAFTVADRSEIEKALNENSEFDSIRYDDVRTAIIVVGTVLIIWAVAALLVSFASFRGQRWARMTLAISGGVSVILQLVAFAAILPVLTALATVAAIVMLFSRDATAWYGRDQHNPYPPQAYYPQQ